MSFFRNSAYNFLGALVPAVGALLTVPVIVAQLGAEDYGVLVLITSIVGYFALLDVNVTSASVKYVAEYHATRDHQKLGQVLTFGFCLYCIIGLIGGGLISFFADALSTDVFRIPERLHPEAVAAIQWAGLGFLVGQLQTYLQSTFQALQRYDLSSLFETLFGTFASLLTLAIVLAGGGLVEIVQARLLLSVVNCVALLHRIRLLLPNAAVTRPDGEIVKSLFSFSAFSYLSKLSSIAAANSDKLFVGALVDMRSLTFFAVPAMLVSRVFGMAFRLAQVMFPVASAMAAQERHAELEATYLAATRQIVFVNAGLCLLLAAFAPELLHYWAGKVFGADAVFVMVFLAIAFFVDSLTNLPSLFNDGLGQPKFTGVTAALRAAAGVGAAYIAIRYFGIRGAAVAQFAVSSIATTAFLVVIHRVSIPVRLSAVLRQGLAVSATPFMCAVALGLLSLTRPILPIPWFLAAMLAATVALAAYGWLFVLDAVMRTRVLNGWRTVRRAA